MIIEIALFSLLSVQGTVAVGSPRLVVRVVDVESHPLPGVPVAFFRAGDPPDRAAFRTVTNSSGEAFLVAVPGARFEVVASLASFIPTRLGPFEVTKERAGRPIVVVLNLSLDWKVILPTPGPLQMDKR